MLIQFQRHVITVLLYFFIFMSEYISLILCFGLGGEREKDPGSQTEKWDSIAKLRAWNYTLSKCSEHKIDTYLRKYM